jgi:hypothetical protein
MTIALAPAMREAGLVVHENEPHMSPYFDQKPRLFRPRKQRAKTTRTWECWTNDYEGLE